VKRLALSLAAAALIAAEPFDPFNEASIDDRPGAQVPMDLPVIAADGSRTTLRRIADGKPVLLAPVLHDCPNICGVTLAGLADALAAQPRETDRKVAVVAFGIDPQETVADAAADRLRNSRLTATFVVGNPPQVHAVTDALGYRYAYDPRIRQYAHVAAIAVLTPEGRLVRWLNGIAPDPAVLGRAVADARVGRTGVFARAIGLLCYHYDPETGRYSLAIGRMIRTAALLTALALAVAIFLLSRRRA